MTVERRQIGASSKIIENDVKTMKTICRDMKNSYYLGLCHYKSVHFCCDAKNDGVWHQYLCILKDTFVAADMTSEA